MNMFDTAVRRVRERIGSAPVDDHIKREAYVELTNLTTAHAIEMSESQFEKMSNGDPSVPPDVQLPDEDDITTVPNDPVEDPTFSKRASIFNPYTPSPEDIDRDNRRMAAQLAVSRDGSFNEGSAQAIYDFLTGA